MKLGVLGIQGAVSEHIISSDLALQGLKIDGETIEVRETSDLKKIDGLFLPGGESTTISGLSHTSGITDYLRTSDLPIFGTCAGMVFMATNTDGPSQNLLNRIDMGVSRNAFGTQAESFETSLDVANLKSFPAVFIRAPIATKVNDPEAKVIATFDDKTVGVQKGRDIALSFHPELTNDLRLHEMFIKSLK